MNFIRTEENFINAEEIYLIVNGYIPENLTDRINLAVENYLSKSRESSLSSYLPLKISIKSLSQKFQQGLNNDDELVLKNDLNLIRNFSVVLFLSNYTVGQLLFPLQNESVYLEQGTLLIYPSSFMYPYKIDVFEGNILEAEYYVDAAPILGTALSRKDNYIL